MLIISNNSRKASKNPFRIKVVYKRTAATYCCRWSRMTQLNGDYNVKKLSYNIFKFCHYCEWEISPEKNTNLLSLGESLDIFLLWLQKCSCFEQMFWVIISKNCRDSTPQYPSTVTAQSSDEFNNKQFHLTKRKLRNNIYGTMYNLSQHKKNYIQPFHS